jgi:hypothetical protein
LLFLRTHQAGQAGTQVPIEGSNHVNEGTPLTFKHYPPSSGAHFPAPQPAGVYKQEVPEGKWVHSLEHSYIVVLLKCADGCPDTYEQLTGLYQSGLPKSSFGNVKLVVTPYTHPFSDPSKEAPITLLAWGRDQMLQSLDRDAIVKFYSAYVDKGPEQVP